MRLMKNRWRFKETSVDDYRITKTGRGEDNGRCSDLVLEAMLPVAVAVAVAVAVWVGSK